MTIAELFVNIGIKGDSKAQKALTGVGKTLGDISASGLAAKAAIAGVVFGLEHMMSTSAANGMALKQFSDFTGMSAKRLQEYQFAARQAGVSSEELTSSVEAIQAAMTNMLLNKGAPSGMKRIGDLVGFDVTKSQDMFYVLQKLQQYAKAAPADLGNEALGSFGMGKNMIAAMRQGIFNESMFKRAPIYGDKEIDQLSRVNVAWANFGKNIEMAFGHLTSKHGLTIVEDISKITVAVLKLGDALLVIAEDLKAFSALSGFVEGLAAFVDISAQGVDLLTGKNKTLSKGAGKALTASELSFLSKTQREYLSKPNSNLGSVISPSTASLSKNPANVNSGNTTTNTFHINEAKEPHKTADTIQKHLNNYVNQTPARAGGY